MSPNSMARSSLEEMLDSLRRRDEMEKPKDMPPALPVRPRAASRSRLPSAKRSLPTNFKIGESELPDSSSNCNVKKEETKGSRRNSFGAKKIKEMDQRESPYVVAVNEKKCERRLEEKDGAELASLPLGSLPRLREPEWDDNLGYFIKKVTNVVKFVV